MNEKKFILQQRPNLDPDFQLQKIKDVRPFPIDKVTAYGLFAFGMLTLIGGGYIAIDQFNPMGQIIGWSAVGIGGGIALKGAFKLGDL